MLIYKIFRGPEWSQMKSDGATSGAAIDVEDGFIHFSTGAQAAETARRYFADQDGLVLVTVESETLGDALKWEPSRGGDLFPHLYRAFRLTDVAAVADLPRISGDGDFPELP